MLETKTTTTNFSISDSDWYRDNGYNLLSALTGGTLNHSNVTVNETTALESSAVYACVKIISEDLGRLPFITYERSTDHLSVEKAYSHPLFPVLKNLVNPEVSSGEFVETLTAHSLLCGDGYAFIQRITSSTGTHITLYPWQPADVRLDRNARGATVYIHKEGNSTEKSYPRDQVFHLRGFTLDCRNGDQIITRARQVLGLTLATQEYAARYFANDTAPGLVIERPVGLQPLGPESVQAIKDAWKKWFRGLSNKHEPAILQDGMTVKVITPDAANAQLNEQRQFQVIEVCRLFRMAPHKLADLSRATYSNIEQQGIDYVTNTLAPHCDRWKRAVHRCLLTMQEQIDDRIYAELNVNALQQGDFAAQAEGFRKLLEKGVYSVNEVRRWLNLNPIEGGDYHFVQINMGEINKVASGTASQPPAGDAGGPNASTETP
jgi:HK97 family phage portal protein